MVIKQLVPPSLRPRSPFKGDRAPILVESEDGLLAYSYVGEWSEVRWFGRMKYGQQIISVPANYQNPYCYITHGLAIEQLNALDELAPIEVLQNTDKYVFFGDLMRWAKAEGLLSVFEIMRLQKWLGEEELS